MPVLNLALQFSAQCNDAGVYTEFKVPEENFLTVAEDVSKLLNEAKNNRNSANWVESYAPICTEFKVGKITEYFMPNAKQIDSYVKYLNKAISGEVQAAEAAKNNPAAAAGATPAPATGGTPAPAPAPAPGTPAPARVLADASTSDAFAPLKVFNDSDKGLPIDDFKVVFKKRDTMINFFNYRSLLPKEHLEAAKKAAAASAPVATSDANAPATTDPNATPKTSRRLRNKRHYRRTRRTRNLRKASKIRKTRKTIL